LRRKLAKELPKCGRQRILFSMARSSNSSAKPEPTSAEAVPAVTQKTAFELSISHFPADVQERIQTRHKMATESNARFWATVDQAEAILPSPSAEPS